MSGRGRYVDVCAGAGGWGLGLLRTGWAGTGLEIDADAVATHGAHVGTCLRCDVTQAGAPHAADLVCGGVPCQPFSASGEKQALDDPRGQLFRSLLRIGGEASARCVVMENVRGLISCGALPVVLDAFRAAGYDPTHSLLNAADYGVAQARTRLFIVGFRSGADRDRFRWPAPTHGAPGNLFGLRPWRTVRDALGLPPVSGLPWRQLDRPSPTVSAGGTEGGGGAEPIANAEIRTAFLAELSRARPDSPGLTLRDCARLQDFPDDVQFSGGIGSQHRQVGNAVPPSLGAAVAGAVWRSLYG